MNRRKTQPRKEIVANLTMTTSAMRGNAPHPAWVVSNTLNPNDSLLVWPAVLR